MLAHVSRCGAQAFWTLGPPFQGPDALLASGALWAMAAIMASVRKP